METEELGFVNFLGETVSLKRPAAEAPPKRRRAERESYHNGWRVQGIPPGALEEGRNEHQRAKAAGEEFKEWDEENWLMNAKRKPVRKPFEIPEAAQQCKALAEKAGWLCVEVVELKKEKSQGAML